jgi:hypothetical protein
MLTSNPSLPIGSPDSSPYRLQDKSADSSPAETRSIEQHAGRKAQCRRRGYSLEAVHDPTLPHGRAHRGVAAIATFSARGGGIDPINSCSDVNGFGDPIYCED